MFDRLKDIVLGRPKAHVVNTGPNRKQKRVAATLRRQRAVAAKRKKHEQR